jgi:hypothetical protein
MMMVFLIIAIRAIKPMHIKVLITHFPPFFDMQEYRMIHLVDQILTLGPLYLHSMFSYEQFLVVLKAYVWNHAHPEGSSMEGYTTEEVAECCADYVKDGKWIGLPIPLHAGRLRGRGRMG